MKKLMFLSFFLILSQLHAQFNIDAELKGYEQKPVLIKIYENGSERLMARIETNANGEFQYRFPQTYVGKIIFELSNTGFEAISDNHDIRFSTNIQDPSRGIQFDGGINEKIHSIYELENKKSLSDFTLVEILKFYQPQDEFYQALEKEINRINQLAANPIENDAVQYYIDARNEIAEYNKNTYTHAQVVEKSKQHLIQDNMNLENFGLLQDFLSQYISFSMSGAQNRDEANEMLEVALDELLEEIQTDTSRGQAILTNVIPLLKGNNFTQLSDKYMNLAESLTCEITPDLQSLIESNSNIEIGKVVPNIEFGEKIKKANSLHDVKADQKLVIFWASWCPHCVREMEHIKSFYTDFSKNGGEIIAISLDIEKQAFERTIAGTQWINYSDLLKWNSPHVKTFGVSATPTMFLLNKDNELIKKGTRVSDFL